MYEYYFTFRSVTAAQSAAKRLEQAGIAAAMLRTPRALQKQGCGYSLRVRAGQFSEARALLTRLSVPFQRIYGKLPEGRWEEVRP